MEGEFAVSAVPRTRAWLWYREWGLPGHECTRFQHGRHVLCRGGKGGRPRRDGNDMGNRLSAAASRHTLVGVVVVIVWEQGTGGGKTLNPSVRPCPGMSYLNIK